MQKMDQLYRQYVMENFFVEDFFEQSDDKGDFLLEERDQGGETKLQFGIEGSESWVIANVDKKNTKFSFMKTDKKLSLGKRVDHIVLEKREDNKWIAHLIEMKTSISSGEKWIEIKGKFRASYLFIQAICAMLHMDLSEVRMYTTYENVVFDYAPENMISRRPRLGVPQVVPHQEWAGGKFTLSFGEECRLFFMHIPIHVTRNQDNILEGQIKCS